MRKQGKLVKLKVCNLLFVLFSIFFIQLTAGWAMEESDKIVITARDIEKMNVRTVPDLLNQIPGVNAGESSVSLRGSYMVKVILDGRTINDPTSGYRAVKWDMVSVNNIDKIEIYKGDGGVEFGDDSSGGVIYITTKKTKGSHGNLETYGGNLGTGSCSMNYHHEVDPVTVGLSAGFEKTDGYRTNGDKEKRERELSSDICWMKIMNSVSPGIILKRMQEGLACLTTLHPTQDPNMRPFPPFLLPETNQ